MKLLLISLALVLIAHIEANKFDYVRNYLAKHDKSSKPIYKRSAQAWLKNSNTIGLGYNPLHGSPVCYTGVCQGDGFQHAIFKLNYVQPAVGSCTNELVPDFVELQCIPSSDLQTSTEMISTSKHLYESTMKRIEFYVAERYRRFAASYFYSKETRSMIDEIYRQNSTAMYTRGEVTFGKLRMFEPFMELADTFRYVIEQMPCCNEFSQETYDYIKEFVIDYFGLSYVTELILGGIAQETMFVGNKEMQELNMRSEEVVRAASIGFLLNFNVQPIPPYNNVQQTQFMQTVQSRRSTKLGGDPSAQTMDDWIRSIPANPVIMNYGVKDISTLLTSKHFASDIHIHNKSKLIGMAILRYLEKHEPVCVNDCTDSAHGICDVTNEPPFQLGTCVCRPGWTGYDCSKKDEPYYPRTTNAPYVPSVPTWDVERSDGVGESSRLNILNSLRTLIDRFGKERKREIAMDLKLWLDKSYTGEWGVTIGGTDCYGSAFSAVANVYLVVNERAWGWRILIWRSS